MSVGNCIFAVALSLIATKSFIVGGLWDIAGFVCSIGVIVVLCLEFAEDMKKIEEDEE